MSILVPCPECGAKLSAPDHAAGKKIRCRKCEAVVRVPEEESATDLPALPGRDDRDDLPRRSPSRRPRDDDEEDRNRSRSKKASKKTPWVPILVGCGLLGLVGFGVAALLLSGGKKKDDNELVFKDGKFFPPKEIPADHPLNKPYVPPPRKEEPKLNVKMAPVDLTPYGLRATIDVPVGSEITKQDGIFEKIAIKYGPNFSLEIEKKTRTREEIKAENADDIKDHTQRLVVDEPNTLLYRFNNTDWDMLYHWTTIGDQPYQLSSDKLKLRKSTSELMLQSVKSIRESASQKQANERGKAAKDAFIKAGGDYQENDSLLQTTLNEETKLDDAIDALKNLLVQNLRLHDAPINVKQAEALSTLSSVRKLYLYGPTITDEVFAHLCRFPNLEEIYLIRTAITDRGMKAFAEAKKLRELVLTDESTKATSAGLAVLKDLQPLQKLTLKNLELSEATMAHLAPLRKLVELDLSESKVADAGLVHLKQLSALTNLNLKNTKITDAGISHLQGLPKIERLDLSENPLASASLASLGTLKTLKYLFIKKTSISDEGLSNLKGLKKLITLDLSSTKITDQALPQLIGMDQLRYLGIEKTTVTEKAMDAFVEKMPNVKITYTKP